jgi:hypothetical protein
MKVTDLAEPIWMDAYLIFSMIEITHHSLLPNEFFD